ncbi:hypothetical protein CLV62_12245 [Dysgonomonas alginatilytica]|uniref:Uncharacterized protein n=1 Tax=Dysgonomonas alginatilytica TaxID=1605892 RepID=A0A2V3PMI8_9BACT|nr:hypothetical protein [Dysgonomonas alginatilytica]PXV62090.1 hypothetical protein CLV62_12245 [Dysgonomonas alginatilytica]
MKKILYLSILLLQIVCSPLYSQIGVYNDSPDGSAILDIQSAGNNQGLLIPQLTTVQKTAIIKPATSLLVYDTDKRCISQNIGSETVPVWTCLTLFNRKFFYMPSINITTSTLGTYTKDLYAQYKTEYATPMYKSTGAPTTIPHFTSPTDLQYYVTYYDASRITINSINANGIMSYTTIKKANYDDYINIVFVVK